MHHGEAKASALANTFGRKEWFSGASKSRLVHARAIITDRKDGVFSRGYRWLAAIVDEAAICQSANGNIARSEVQAATAGHGITCIGSKIEEREFQLIWVGTKAPEIRSKLLF